MTMAMDRGRHAAIYTGNADAYRHRRKRRPMPLSGEAIRLMNYVDDVSTTLRRMIALSNSLTQEERNRVSEYLSKSEPSVPSVVESLKTGK
jgi:hypothetical protein